MQFQGFDWLSGQGIFNNYTMPEKQRPLNCLLVVLAKRNQQDLKKYFLIVFNKTIIHLALVGYEMMIGNSALRASLAMYLSSHIQRALEE